MLKLNISARYDNDLSQIYFDEFKNGVDGSHVLLLGDKATDYCIIFENEEIANQSFYKKSRLQKLTKAELYAIENNFNLTDELIDEITKAELIDLLMTVTNKDYYLNQYNNINYYDWDCDFEIHGYCQSDCLKVKKVGSSEWCEKQYSANYLSNLFFDSPISGKIELMELSESESGFISDCAENSIFEIYIDELLSDCYNYDKDEIISNFEKLNLAKLSDKIGELQNKYNLILQGYIKDYLQANLPNDPDYV